MIREITAAAMAMALLSQAPAKAQDERQDVFSPTMWRTFNWAHAESSPIWSTGSWREIEGEEPRFTTPRQRTVAIGGNAFELTTSINRAASSPYAVIEVSAWGREGGCRAIATAASRLGAPSVERNGSYLVAFGDLSSPLEQLDETMQWRLGSTSATFQCLGTDPRPREADDPQGVVGLLTFEPLASARPLIPLVALRCDFVGGNQPRAPITIVLDQYRNRILQTDLRPFATAIFTDTAIAYSLLSDPNSRFSIDRRTGTLTAPGRSLAAQCETITLDHRAF